MEKIHLFKEECARHGVYLVNLKFKERYFIDASLYTYLCIAICISADVCICDRLKLGSTAALDCRTGKNKDRYLKKDLLFLLV